MNRLAHLPKAGIVATFITAGDPTVKDSAIRMADALQNGTDMLVVAIPFSDPTAESPEVQAAGIRALKCGITTSDVFTMIGDLRRISDVPIVIYSYMNPVFRYGYDAFFGACGAMGVNGVILSDLPHEEMDEVARFAAAHGIAVIPVVTLTSKERIPMLVSGSEDFVYAWGFDDADALQGARQAIRACCDLPVIANGGGAFSGVADGLLAAFTGA